MLQNSSQRKWNLRDPPASPVDQMGCETWTKSIACLRLKTLLKETALEGLDRDVRQGTFQTTYSLTFHVNVNKEQNNRWRPVIALVVPAIAGGRPTQWKMERFAKKFPHRSQYVVYLRRYVLGYENEINRHITKLVLVVPKCNTFNQHFILSIHTKYVYFRQTLMTPAY